MTTITLKDIPDFVHRALKRRARDSGRSLNRELVNILTSAVAPTKIDSDEMLKRLREHRRSLPGELTEKLLREAKSLGRP